MTGAGAALASEPEQRLEVVLLQEQERLLLVDLLQGLEQAPLPRPEQVLFRVPGQGPAR